MTRFRFGEKIGSGGFGVVSHATRVEDGSPFAVKHLSVDVLSDEDAVRRFRREVRLQRELQHPNIVPIVGANLSATPPWFVMPIAERTLFTESQAKLEESEVQRIFEGVLKGLEYAHSQSVIHRDLKPENVLITHNGEPQISDFGLGKNLLSKSTALTKTTVGMGSIPYVAPEQILDARDADQRSDIYALGKMLQFMVTGKLPVITPHAHVPRKYRYFIEKCCAAEADERYQTVEEVIVAFGQVSRGIERPRPVREIADELLDQWTTNNDAGAITKFLELLDQRADDRSLYERAIPMLDADAIALALTRQHNDFRRVLKTYDEYVSASGGLDFEYCDVVADLYRRVYFATDDLQLRKMLLSRLLDIGHMHNRYYVGNVVAALISSAKETSEVMMVVDVLRDNSDHAEWFKPNPLLREAELAPPIDEALYGHTQASGA